MQLTLEDLNRFTPEELIAICSVKWPGGYDRNELLRAGLAIYPVYRAARARERRQRGGLFERFAARERHAFEAVPRLRLADAGEHVGHGHLVRSVPFRNEPGRRAAAAVQRTAADPEDGALAGSERLGTLGEVAVAQPVRACHRRRP